GDTVAIVSPSSSTMDASQMTSAVKRMERMGYEVIVGEHALARHGHLAGRDDERLADVHAMFARDDVKAVLCMRGGNGAPRLLPQLDYDLIRAHPKIFIGYSDITALHLAIHRLTGLVTFHGPIVAGLNKSDYSLKYFQQALTVPQPLGVIDDPDEKNPYPPYRVVIRDGEAHGPLVGGNLTLIEQTLGTPYEIETRGKVLFIEDTGEEPYAIDRMLTHLRHADKLQSAAAILFGESTDCGIKNTFYHNFGLEDVIRDRLSDLGMPVVYGMRFGHGTHQFTLPLGVRATLRARHGDVQFSIDEAATVNSER
ncbi:MAG: LD-carboxypeptidase, partial [Chloroflexota bacterium]